MFPYLILLLGIVGCGRAPFIQPNEVHQAYSELEVNLILNENKNAVVLMGAGRHEDQKAKKGLEGILQNAFEREPYAGFALLVDCDQFQNNLDGRMNLCRKTTQGVRLLLFKPSTRSLMFFEHEVLGTQEVLDVTDNTDAAVIAKRVRDAIPNFVKEIEDQYDLDEFLRDTTMTKLIYFEQQLLNPPYLQKISARYMRRLDVGISDSKQLAKKYNAKFPSIVMLDYNFTSNSYDQYDYNGTTDFEERPFDDVCGFIEPHVLPNRSRDILLDFELIEATVLNLSSTKHLQKLIKQDKMVIAELDIHLQCGGLKKWMDKYSTMFNYACLNISEAEFSDVAASSVLLFQHDVKQRLLLNSNSSIDKVLQFPEIKQMVSTEKEADMCTELAGIKNKIIVMSYYPLKSHNAFLVRYLNSLTAFNSIFQFCQVYNPDKFVEKQYSLKQNTLFALIPQPGGQASQKVENTAIKTFGDIKLFLREIAVNKLLGLYEQAVKNRIKYITTPQDLTKYCFSKPCVLSLINIRKATRAQQEIRMMSDFAYDFEKQFNIVWLDGHCHKEILNEFKIKPEQLSALAFFNEKTNHYAVYAGKYWIQKDVKKWLKSLRSQPALKRLKYSLDMESRACRQEEEL